MIFLSLSFLCILNNREIKRRLRSTKVLKNYKPSFEDEEEQLLSKVKNLQYQNELATMLSRAIQIPTISYDTVEEAKKESNSTVMTNGDGSDNPLNRMHELLRGLFPLLHQKYPPVIIHQYSLLFIIPGKSDDKLPIMLCAHMDVVPAPVNENVDSDRWIHEPFSGEILDGFIWGRGAIDNKNNMISQLAAMEFIIQQNITLPRTVYLSLGHDEEVGGFDGAANIAKYLKDQPNFTQFEYILDEGTMMVKGSLPGFASNIAMISTCEKGCFNVELSVSGPGGHSSMPPIKGGGSIVSILGEAIKKLETHPQPTHFEKGSSLRLTLEYLSRETAILSPSFPFNIVYSNLWLFGPIIKRLIATSSNAAAAMVRSTTAICKIHGGTKLNVLPFQVKAYVNHRVHPLDTFESVVEHNRKVINDQRIKIRIIGGDKSVPASPISPHDNQAFQCIEQCVHKIFGFPTTPSVLIGNTDTRHYWDLSQNIYRFSPLALTIEELKMFHGVNERISTDSLSKMVLFYCALITQSY